MVRITIWNEFVHETSNEKVKAIYPRGIHGALAEGLRGEGRTLRTATLREPEHGLTEEALRDTDVLVWWGHMAHEEVSDAIVDRVHARVLEGMGLIVLHSAHGSKIFRKLMGTQTGRLKWREADEKERLWVVKPSHPIARGLPEAFELEREEMYGEHFDVPDPEELVFVSWFQGGEVFRSGLTYTRGKGRVFYFRPGHESYPTYYDPHVLRVISNACDWAAPGDSPDVSYGHVPSPMEPIR
ncbi:trehalose utilization protein ThuA [Paenibacillus antri]|uniref:Trehalose utilization protein ThuA n=1 Tax=Paenibacillus antri TaxID=2582848 RepID=A0A5R9G3J1_9BACL|nr:ThuA domain-containing protein [Paenibacillus antri]TLS50937.1 trehalose utilization protein ThuA [Paenibacillus antri]